MCVLKNDAVYNKISVIVPVYNVKEYLDECIESILDQSYNAFELLLIDDGSTDGSGDMCDRWQEKDERIRVIHKENKGVSDARNVGIDHAQGEYITFVDSDDVIHKECLKRMHEIALHYQADIVQCKTVRRQDRLGESNEKRIVYSNFEALKIYFLMHGILDACWAKLYHRSILGEIRFPLVKIHEDVLTTYKFIARAKKVVVTSDALYWYRLRDNSITNSGFDEKRLVLLQVPSEIRSFLGENVNGLESEIEYYIYKIEQGLLNTLLLNTSKNMYRNEKKEILKIIENTLRKNQYVTSKNRFQFILIKYCKPVYVFMLSAREKIRKRGLRHE